MTLEALFLVIYLNNNELITKNNETGENKIILFRRIRCTNNNNNKE